MNTTQSGFTLMEFMVTTAIAAILLATAAPSFRTSILNNRVITESNKLVSDIALARSEAMKRGVQVIICPSDNAGTDAPTCADGAWPQGWLVFASGDTNSSFDSGADTLLKATVADQNVISVTVNTTANDNLRFNARGSTDESGNIARFAFCDERGSAYGKQLEIPSVGRPRHTATVSSCTTPT